MKLILFLIALIHRFQFFICARCTLGFRRYNLFSIILAPFFAGNTRFLPRSVFTFCNRGICYKDLWVLYIYEYFKCKICVNVRIIIIIAMHHLSSQVFPYLYNYKFSAVLVLSTNSCQLVRADSGWGNFGGRTVAGEACRMAAATSREARAAGLPRGMLRRLRSLPLAQVPHWSNHSIFNNRRIVLNKFSAAIQYPRFIF